jgi:hypothetical protein
MVNAFTLSAQITNSFFQQLLNHRVRSVGGASRLMALIQFCYHSANVCSGLSFVIGEYTTRPGVSWSEFIAFLFSANQLYQALTLRYPRISEDDHVE